MRFRRLPSAVKLQSKKGKNYRFHRLFLCQYHQGLIFFTTERHGKTRMGIGNIFYSQKKLPEIINITDLLKLHLMIRVPPWKFRGYFSFIRINFLVKKQYFDYE